jgi:soluble lytic murein transglycosylase-like protein
MKWIVLITLLITFYSPDKLSGYEKMREYFPNMKERHYVEIRKNISDPEEAKYFMSIIQYESRYNERAYNGYDAGIAQINRVHGDAHTFFDYKKGIEFGASYFRKAVKSTRRDFSISVIKYNAGHNANLAKYKNWSYVRRVCFKYDEIKDIKI